MEDFEIILDMCGYTIKRSTAWDGKEVVAKKCSGCKEWKWADGFYRSTEKGLTSLCHECTYQYYYDNKDMFHENVRNWYHRNPEKARKVQVEQQNKRRVTSKGLPYRWSDSLKDKVLERFIGGCALTGSDDIHWDHVIPVSIGHGGTILGNMIPLRSDLNVSKNNRNIFEWFPLAKKRFNLSQTKFDELIEYLAKVNDMTTNEYRDYVYWCHDNPIDSAG